MKKNFNILILLLTSSLIYSQSQTDLDFYFSANTNDIFDHQVFSFNQQSNQQILVGTASTTTWNKTEYLKRLNLDGTLDNSFIPPKMIGSTLKIVVQPDDKIILGTSHLYGVGGNQKDIIRLNKDGTIDQSFQKNLDYLKGNGGYNGVALQSDGKILVAGKFTTVSNTEINGIIRLNSNGLWDSSFSLGGSGIQGNHTTYQIIPLSNGKILIGGGLGNYNGSSYNGLLKLNSDGSLDTTFNIGTGFENSWVDAIAVQDDGKILVGGRFGFFNGDNTKKRLIRLNQDGSIDNTFFPPLTQINGSVRSIDVLSDNKIMILGSMTKKVIKLNLDGTIDTSFDIGTGFNNTVRGFFEQTDGHILVGGAFTRYQSYSSPAVARILGNSVLSTKNFNKNFINIYPNPASKNIYLDLDESYSYEVYNILGGLILKESSIGKSININSLHNGIYILKIKTGKYSYSHKFIKQ